MATWILSLWKTFKRSIEITSFKSLRALQNKIVLLIWFHESEDNLRKATLSYHPNGLSHFQAELLSIVPDVTVIVQRIIMKLIYCYKCTMLKKTVDGTVSLVCCLFPAGSRAESQRILVLYQPRCFCLFLKAFSPSLSIIWVLVRKFTNQHLSPCPLWTSHKNIFMDSKQFHLYHFSLLE